MVHSGTSPERSNTVVKDDKLYLIHVRECIERINLYTAEGKEFFFTDAKTQDAVIRNLQILAESTQRVSASLRKNHPEINWRNIAGFRNVAVHDYLGIDLKQIWVIVESDLPELKYQIEKILNEINL